MTARMARFAARIACILLIGSAIACGGSSTTATTPTPQPVLSTETFTGVLAPLGSDSHTFNVNYSAGYTNSSITVTSLKTVANSTDVSITIGVGFGTTNLGVCTRAISNATAPLNQELPTSGTPFIAGTFCVQVFDNPDSPTVTEPLNYSITVKHY